jgi:hypothetical protein
LYAAIHRQYSQQHGRDKKELPFFFRAIMSAAASPSPDVLSKLDKLRSVALACASPTEAASLLSDCIRSIEATTKPPAAMAATALADALFAPAPATAATAPTPKATDLADSLFGAPPSDHLLLSSKHASLVGQKVLLSGLLERPDLNGLLGEVVSFSPETSRCAVSVNGEHSVSLPAADFCVAQAARCVGPAGCRRRASTQYRTCRQHGRRRCQ